MHHSVDEHPSLALAEDYSVCGQMIIFKGFVVTFWMLNYVRAN